MDDADNTWTLNTAEDPEAVWTREHARKTAWTRREARRFQAEFPAPRTSTPALTVSWEMLERQLARLADTPAKKAMAGPLVSATRKQAWCKPDEMVLAEILSLAGLLQDESFTPGLLEADPESPEPSGGDCPMA